MKKWTVLGLIPALCLTLCAPAMAMSGFADVPSRYWAYDQIAAAVDAGITTGYADGTFQPTANVTNAHFAAFLARAFYAGEYDDTDASPWYKPYVDVLDSHHILDGATAGSSPSASINKPIDRCDMAQMMYNVLVDKGVEMPTSSELRAAQSAMGDWAEVPVAYRTAVATCYALEVLNGQTDGNFGGQNLMNRAQGCVVVYRLTQKIGSMENAPAVPPAGAAPSSEPVSVQPPADGTSAAAGNTPEISGEPT